VVSVLGRVTAGNPIGLGLAAVGRPAYINLGRDQDLGDDRSRGELERRAHAVLDAAWAAGVRYLDAARSYGLAEAFLASWLAAAERSAPAALIGSKWGYTYTGQWRMTEAVQERKDLSAATFRRQLAETRELLGDCLSLYQVHSATIESGVLDDDELLAELTALRHSGVAIGVTVTGPHQGETIDRALEIGIFDTVQATWNLLERSAAPALQRAHDAGVGVIVKEALANGQLTNHGAEPALLAYAKARDLPPDAVAIAAAISQPWSDVVLSGAVSPEMLASNMRALELDLEAGSPADDLSHLSVDAAGYWARRSRLSWR
jgi:aryl-alcohol dehydrogenase-like predicted oxidoreductase